MLPIVERWPTLAQWKPPVQTSTHSLTNSVKQYQDSSRRWPSESHLFRPQHIRWQTQSSSIRTPPHWTVWRTIYYHISLCIISQSYLTSRMGATHQGAQGCSSHSRADHLCKTEGWCSGWTTSPDHLYHHQAGTQTWPSKEDQGSSSYYSTYSGV